MTYHIFTNLKKSWHEGTLRTSPTIHNLHHATIIKLVNPVYVIYILCIHVYTESKKYLLYDLSIPLIGDSSVNSVKINKQTHVGKITPREFYKDVPTGLWPRRLKINSRSNYRWFYYGYSSNSSPEKKETFTHRPVALSLHHCAANYGPTHLSDEVDHSSKEGPGFDAIRWDAAISLRTYHWMYTPEI